MWKLDREGNLTSIRQGLRYCAHCEQVKEVVETVLTERVAEEDQIDLRWFWFRALNLVRFPNCQ